MSAILSRIYDDAIAITTSDSVVQGATQPFAGLLILTAGTVVLVTAAGNTLTFGSLTAGTEIHVRVKQVKATGTSATVAGLRGLTAGGLP